MNNLTRSSYVKITLIILLCLVLCGGLGGGCNAFGNTLRRPWEILGAWSTEHLSKGLNTNALQLGNAQVDPSSVKSINITWAAGSADVEVVDDNEIDGQIDFVEELIGPRSLPQMRWSLSDGILAIDYGDLASIQSCSAFGSKHLTVKIPRTYAGAFDSFLLEAASGDYRLSGIGCHNFEIDLASGKIESNNCTAEHVDIEIASGDITFSGDITEKLDIDQASGATSITTKSLPEDNVINLASGRIVFAIPDKGFKANVDRLSGNFNSTFELLQQNNTYLYGDGGAQMQISMGSGQFVLEKLT